MNWDDPSPQPGADSQPDSESHPKSDPKSDGGSGYRTPRWRTLLARGATLACPACGSRGLFRRSLRIVDDCPRCGLHFERIEGHWIGSVGMNTIISFFLLMMVLIVGLVSTFPDFPVKELMMFGIGVAIIHPIVFHPTSQTLWCAVDMLMRKLEPHEVDWRYVSRKPAKKRLRAPS